MKAFILSVLLCALSINISAQSDSLWAQKPLLSLLGFADIFYVYDFNQPNGTSRQAFLFNHNRHNEFNINLGLIKFGIEHPKYRANLALQTGTYANDNYAAEPGLLKNIFEANVGLSLNSNNTVWLDVGVLPSHIGFESAISMDNMTLTRSLLAENSPYFLTGAKLSYQPSPSIALAVLMVNGWQRIQRLEGNSLPSFGTQVILNPSESLTFNWSTFMGTDDPDSMRRMRYFNNLYCHYVLSNRVEMIIGFDSGLQQSLDQHANADYWFSPIIISRYALSEKWNAALRIEYYQDRSGVIIPVGIRNDFETFGYSINVDYNPVPNLSCRLEGRWLNSKDDIFESAGALTNSNFSIGASMAIRFAEILGNAN